MEDISKEDLLSRLLAKTTITNDGHYLWTGLKDKDGYGLICVRLMGKSRNYGVHRLSAFIHHNLKLDDWDQYALHKTTCKHRNCWGKDCIYVGTSYQNGTDRQSMRTHCKNGHPLSVYGFLQRRPLRGDRIWIVCRRCKNKNNLRSYHSRKQEKLKQTNKVGKQS